MKKPFKSLLALILVFSMLLPGVTVFAANGLVGEDKAIFELVYLDAKDSPAAGEFGFQEVAKADLPTMVKDQEFYVGLRIKNLDAITDASEGVLGASTYFKYDKNYVQPEEGAWDANVVRMEYDGSLLSDKSVTGAYLYEYDACDKVEDGLFGVGISWKYPNTTAGKNAVPAFKGTTDCYIAVIKFTVINVPTTNGATAFSFEVTDDEAGTGNTMSFGTGNSVKSHNWFTEEGDPTGENDETNMRLQVEFDTSGVDIFPTDYKFSYDANLTNADNAALDVDANTVNPDLSTADTGTVQKGQNFTAAMNLAVSAQTTAGTNVAVTGWYTDADCTNAMTFVGTMDDTLAALADPDGTIKLYAKWAAANIIKLDGNGGTATVDSASVGEVSYTVPSGTDITLSGQGKTVPTFSRDGYTHSGWYRAASTNYDPTTDDNIPDPANEPIIATETWYVKWTPANDADKVTVNFNGNADGVTVSPASVIVKKDASVNTAEQGATGYNMPADPTRTNYTFAGWNTAANGTGTAFTGTTPVVDNLLNTDTDGDSTNDAVTVYAQWTVTSEADADKWTVNFHAYNPADNASVTVAPAQVEVDAKPGTPVTVAAAQMPNDPAVTGYELVGWYEATDPGSGIYEAVDPKVEYRLGSTISKDMDVVAVFGKQASVTLHMQDGKDPETTKTLNGLVGDKIADLIKEDYADEAAFVAAVKPNYTFQGWGKAAQTAENTATGPEYQNYATAAIVEGDTDLYAWWQTQVSAVVSETNAVYTGTTIDWKDILSVQFAIADDEGGEISYVPATDLTIDNDYTLEIWKGANKETGTKLAALTDLKDAGEYFFEFTSKNLEVRFLSADGTFTIDKAKIAIKVNSDPVKSDEQSTVQILPNITITIGDETLNSTSEDETERTRVENILKDMGAKYIPLVKGDKNYAADDTKIEDTDINSEIRTAVESNPYMAGEYVVVIQPKDDANYEVDKDTSKGGLVTNKITGNLGTNYSDATDFAFLTTVEANSRTVTFQNVNNMTEKTLTTIGDPVVVKNGEKINDGLNEGAPSRIPEATKHDNYEFVGWYIMPESMTTYDQLAADVNGASPTAVEFTTETVIDKNMTVVAVWKTSTDSGLKDPDPSNPDDHVGGLKLTKKVSTDTSDVVEIKQLYDSDYTTAKNFTAKAAEGGNNNYYVRVENKYDNLQITLETGEPGATVAVWKLADGKEVPTDTTGGEQITMTDNASGDITLTVAIDAKANIFKIEVTAPDGVTKSEYYVFVQRMNVARIELNYGNSPYGLIMADNAITDKTTAKTEFNKANKFVAGFTPANAPTRTYSPKAWENSVDPNVNLDRNDYAIFVYNRTKFRDPGFTAIDTLGNSVELTNVTIDMDVQLTGTGTDALSKPTAQTVHVTSPDSNKYLYTQLESVRVRPDSYTITYTFIDPYLPSTDSDSDGVADNVITETRDIVFLNNLGDADNNGLVNLNDRYTIIDIFNKVLYPEYSGRELYMYRITDADGNGLVNLNDRYTIIDVFNKIPAEPFYVSLPSE